MTTLDTVTLPRQAGPVEPPRTATVETPAPARPLLGKDRPRTDDERLFLYAVNAMFLLLAIFSTTLIVLSDRVWG